jgi:4'-phosphopantetheinyl transferase
VHVWRVRVPPYGRGPAGWHALLDAEERHRLNRKHHRSSYQRELTARATLRLLLGSYLKCAPQSIRLAREAAGKPRLASHGHTCPLEFNLSHAGDWVLLAFAAGVRVGVDVEAWRPMEYDEIVRRNFAPAELHAWDLVGRADQQEAFFAAWTRKEAYLKATGRGLTQPLESFAVRYTPSDAPAELLWCAEGPGEPQRWTLVALAPGKGYSAALAVEAASVHLARRTWQTNDTHG